MAWFSKKQQPVAVVEPKQAVAQPKQKVLTGPRLAVLTPDIAGISSFRLNLQDHVADAEGMIAGMRADVRRGTHAFWAMHDKPAVDESMHVEALVLIRAKAESDLVYVVSFLDLESALSFTRFELRRGLYIGNVMIYWAAFTQIREELEGVSILPSVAPPIDEGYAGPETSLAPPLPQPKASVTIAEPVAQPERRAEPELESIVESEARKAVERYLQENPEMSAEPVAEERPVIEESVAVVEPPVVEQAPPVMEPVIEEARPFVEPPVIEEARPFVEQPVIEEARPVVERPVVEQAWPVIEPPVIEEAPPVIEPPVTEEELAPVIEPPVIEEARAVFEPPVVEEARPFIEPPVVEEARPFIEPPVIEEEPAPVIELPIFADEPVSEEAAVADALVLQHAPVSEIVVELEPVAEVAPPEPDLIAQPDHDVIAQRRPEQFAPKRRWATRESRQTTDAEEVTIAGQGSSPDATVETHPEVVFQMPETVAEEPTTRVAEAFRYQDTVAHPPESVLEAEALQTLAERITTYAGDEEADSEPPIQIEARGPAVDPANGLPQSEKYSEFDIALEVERLLKNRKWESKEGPFRGFKSPPGKF